MASRSSPRRLARPQLGYGRREIFAIALVLLVSVAALGGGSSRDDVLATMLIRALAVILLAACVAFRPDSEAGALRETLFFPGIVAALIAIQLVPLPHMLWSALPGRDFYDVEAQFGLPAAPWRPISLTPDLTLNALLALLPPAAAAAAMLLAGSEARIRMIGLFALIAALSAVLGLAQMGAGDGTVLRYYEITNEGSPVGIFANRNHQAAFLVCAMPLAAGWAALYRDERSAGGRLFAAALLAGLVLIVVPLSGSRSGVLLALLGVFGALAVYMQSRARSRGAFRGGWRFWAPVGGFLVLLAGALVFLSSRSQAIERLLATNTVDEQRLAWFGPLSDLALRFMPIGAGYGSFAAVFRQFEPHELLATTYVNEAHNELLQIVIEGGVPALLLLGVFLFWWGRRSLAVWTSGSRSPEALAARVGSLVIAILLISSLADYPLRTPFGAVFFAVACVWLGGFGRNRSPLPSGRESV